MPGAHNFEHLPLLLRYRGTARLHGGRGPARQTVANRDARNAHARALRAAAQSTIAGWQVMQRQPQAQNLPAIQTGIPLLLLVDPSVDPAALREKSAFEI